MNKRQQQQMRAVAHSLGQMVALTFQCAYTLHTHGMSETAMLIDFDIQAAAAGQDETVNECARETIKAAVRAIKTRTPLVIALPVFMLQVDDYLQQVMADITAKQKSKHAVDKDTTP